MCPFSFAMCAEWNLEGTWIVGPAGREQKLGNNSLQHEFSSVRAPVDPMASDLRRQHRTVLKASGTRWLGG